MIKTKYMEYTVDYFIEKFQNIPYKDWGVRELVGDGNAKCALGHCGWRRYEASGPLRETVEGHALIIFFRALKVTNCIGSTNTYYNLVNINDGNTREYRQVTPKGRILAALYDIKKLQQPQFIPRPPIQLNPNKSKIRYVVLKGMEEKELVTEN